MLKVSGSSSTASAHNRMSWSWKDRTSTPEALFGNGTEGARYAFCVYGTSVETEHLTATALVVPAGGTCRERPCWKTSKGKVAYNDGDGATAGIRKLSAKTSRNSTTVAIQARGVNLPMPGLPLSMQPEVIVQLRNNVGGCWEARYEEATRNDGSQYVAKTKGVVP